MPFQDAVVLRRAEAERLMRSKGRKQMLFLPLPKLPPKTAARKDKMLDVLQVLSDRILSYPILSYPILSYPILPYQI